MSIIADYFVICGGNSERQVRAISRDIQDTLRDEGVLVMGSGFLTHNLGRVDWSEAGPVPGWARDFDAWAAEALARRDVDALLDFERRGPSARIALPTTEHFVPLLVALGAADGEPAPPTFPITGFWLGSLTRRSVQFGPGA